MDAVEEIKERLAIEDVISQYVELKRAGRNFKGISPFTQEKTASFMVSPEKQIWHDFSSGKGGNVFSFVMEMEGVDFKGALEILARQAGVDLQQFQRRPGDGQLKEQLLAAHQKACLFYQKQLVANKEAISYVAEKRGLRRQTVLDFKIGYAPNSNDALLNYLKQQGFDVTTLQKAGLVNRSHRGPGDMFRGRLMIPLMDAMGQVIGFTGRLLQDIPNAPKYLNTPQTPLYDKSRHVFGLHLAKQAIRNEGYVVVVEGNMDVVASHQAGVKNVVATAGTAITTMHLKALGRFVDDVRLAFDQDDAGIRAAERAIPLAANAGVNLSIVTVIGAKDPDELIQKDPKAWEAAIGRPVYALDWLMQVYQERLDLSKAIDKRRYSDIILGVVRQLKDPVEQEHYLAALAKILGVSPEALLQKLNTKTSTKLVRRKTVAVAPVSFASAERIKTENHLLSLALKVPNLRSVLEPLQPEMFQQQQAQKVFRFLQANTALTDDATIAKQLADEADYVKILLVIFDELYQNLEALELRYEAARLQVRLIEHYVKQQKQNLIAAMQTADESETEQLLQQVKVLDALLKNPTIKRGATDAKEQAKGSKRTS